MMQKQLTYITSSPFWRQSSNGQWARAQSLIQFLAPRVQLKIIYLGQFTEADIKAIRASHLDFHVAATGAKTGTTTLLEKVRNLLNQAPPEVCLVETVRNAFVLDALPKQTLKILDSLDLISQRTEQLARLGLEYGHGLSEAEERDIFGRFDVVLCIQEEEYGKARHWLGAKRTILSPHPCHTNAVPPQAKVTRIGMVASNYHANVDGLNHFLFNVWPLIEDREIQLNVFGTVASGFRAIQFKRIHFHGFRPSLRDCYNNIDIVINPVRYGSGLKIKSIEAMAHGLPLVTTEEGASGLKGLDGKALVIARSDLEFAAAINRLTHDAPTRKTMAAEGLDYVATHLTPEACFQGLLERINAAPARS